MTIGCAYVGVGVGERSERRGGATAIFEVMSMDAARVRKEYTRSRRTVRITHSARANAEKNSMKQK